MVFLWFSHGKPTHFCIAPVRPAIPQAFLETREISVQPLLQTLLPALQGQQVRIPMGRVGKTIGKPQENGGLVGFNMKIYGTSMEYLW